MKVSFTCTIDAEDRGRIEAEAERRGWSLTATIARILAGYVRSTEVRQRRLVELGVLAEAEVRTRE